MKWINKISVDFNGNKPKYQTYTASSKNKILYLTLHFPITYSYTWKKITLLLSLDLDQ